MNICITYPMRYSQSRTDSIIADRNRSMVTESYTRAGFGHDDSLVGVRTTSRVFRDGSIRIDYESKLCKIRDIGISSTPI